MMRPGRRWSSRFGASGSVLPGRRRQRWRHSDNSRGLVTVELAVSILAAGLLLTLLAWAIFVVLIQVRCIDSASEVARQAARGDEAAVTAAKRKAPDGASITIDREGDRVLVEVSVSARPASRGLPPIPLTATAEAIAEPGEE